MIVVADVVFDSERPSLVARFWAEALDGYEVAPYDEDELERLRGIGVDDPADDPTVLVVGPAGSPRYFFVRVPEDKVSKNRVHLDLRAEDPVLERARLITLGGRVLVEQEGWTVMADPEGNEFCLLKT